MRNFIPIKSIFGFNVFNSWESILSSYLLILISLSKFVISSLNNAALSNSRFSAASNISCLIISSAIFLSSFKNLSLWFGIFLLQNLKENEITLWNKLPKLLAKSLLILKTSWFFEKSPSFPKGTSLSKNCELLTTEKDYLRIKKSFRKSINFLKVELLINQHNQ